MSAQEGRKNKIQGVSLSPELLAHAKSCAATQHGGNLSRYIQSLIEADMRQVSKPHEAQSLTAKFIVAEAALLVLPDKADEFPKLMAGRSQFDVMRSLLNSLHTLLQREERVRHIANVPLKRFAVIPSFDSCMEEDGWQEVVSEVCAEEIEAAYDEFRAMVSRLEGMEMHDEQISPPWDDAAIDAAREPIDLDSSSSIADFNPADLVGPKKLRTRKRTNSKSTSSQESGA